MNDQKKYEPDTDPVSDADAPAPAPEPGKKPKNPDRAQTDPENNPLSDSQPE